MKDIKVLLDDRPGALAEVAEALGSAGVNIDGICGFACERKVGEDRELITQFTHILVDDPVSARRILNKAGIRVVDERDVVVPEIEDRPGELGRVARKIADMNVNIDFFYTVSKDRVVMGVSHLEKALSALKSP